MENISSLGEEDNVSKWASRPEVALEGSQGGPTWSHTMAQ